jgi:hypothetical protein
MTAARPDWLPSLLVLYLLYAVRADESVSTCSLIGECGLDWQVTWLL